MSPFELIRAEAVKLPREKKRRVSVSRLCQLMMVSRSGFYDWCARPQNDVTMSEPVHERLLAKIRAIQESCDWVYGSRRLQSELVADGEQVGRRLIRRLVRENGLYPVQEKLFKKTTDSEHSLGYSPNLLKQDFSTNSADQVWVSDITYVWTGEGWSYLAVVLDLYSRRVVGWAIDDNMRAELVVTAFERALRLRMPPKGLLAHSDRGSQYASGAHRDQLRKHGVRQSMSGAGNCYDNAVAESFFATIKKECISRRHFATRTEAFDAINSYIRGFYNPTRRHSALGYSSPMDYERETVVADAA